MRKQKSSDRRTRRMQRGDFGPGDGANVSPSSTSSSFLSTVQQSDSRNNNLVNNSPMSAAKWKHKRTSAPGVLNIDAAGGNRKRGGRGRAQKRSYTYAALSAYHSLFCELLGLEFSAEESEVLDRIELSRNDPLALEDRGHALFDMYPERRGNIFTEEVYRLTKAHDAASLYITPTTPTEDDNNGENKYNLPSNSQFSDNDVIILTKQPRGSGDIFDAASVPTDRDAIKCEARVIGTGPRYIDVAMPKGAFETAFGPAPNDYNNSNEGGKDNQNLRLRADRFFSNVPYNRMVSAISQITALPERMSDEKEKTSIVKRLDPALREVVISTYGHNNPDYPAPDADLQALAKKIAKPPFKSSTQLANEVLRYIQANPNRTFPPFNPPQLTSIAAALSRRFTMIQGPPGTGKTTVAAAIGFGFVHQSRQLSPHAKVLACAFSNVGADQLALSLIKVGLKVVRVGRPSSIAPELWDSTLDAAIEKDPDAQRALSAAAEATALLRKNGSNSNGRYRELATAAVKASIQACRVAGTKALRDCDVIVSTSIGASDPQILAACGIVGPDDEEEEERAFSASNNQAKDRKSSSPLKRDTAPDGLPPLVLPFTIIDEACQSIEPATLVPLVSTDSCRSLVLLGDPCQLPPTVKTDPSGTSYLSNSLMSRLAATLPAPVIVTAKSDNTNCEDSFLRCRATRRAESILTKKSGGSVSYRKQFAGSLLLSVQYRMHPSISAFPSAIFYDGLLSTPRALTAIRTFPDALDSYFPKSENPASVRFLDVGGCNNEKRGERTATDISLRDAKRSYSNSAEAVEVVRMVKALLGIDGDNAGDLLLPTVGIVSPYSSQVALLKKMVEEADFSDEVKSLIEINSVDGYQGRERDIIILSTVRSNRNSNVGFLSDWRRMNVAITRAKSGLVVVGDAETLSRGDKHWDAFTSWCTDTGCISK
eukprot:CAMPEP_0116048430 /NCGR_PEP_ID=MMETSP0321-20121206/29548_1 /TAXON_ID=163516 /ORGANISM="Leptocylindrus danicus var. danicus, Strain B650" /LENGTH=938 /DNA_ID=CAMNT_0003530631 /DNA_START=274 /DNA_END=3087 /DNA_ORIENTATION=-